MYCVSVHITFLVYSLLHSVETYKYIVQCMDEHLVKTMAMVAGGLLAGVAITKASSALADVSVYYFCSTFTVSIIMILI